MIRYFLKKKNELIWSDISTQISDHLSCTESINSLPQQFDFEVISYKRLNNQVIHSNLIIDRNDNILITDQNKVLVFGRVQSLNKKIISWDSKQDRAIFTYSVRGIAKDFSTKSIDKKEFITTTQEQITSAKILDFILSTINTSVNAPTKYITDFISFDVDSYNIQDKTEREALTDFCLQYELFWTLNHTVLFDTNNQPIVTSEIFIGSKDGLTSNIIQLSDMELKTGKINNPILASNYKRIQGYQNFEIEEDETAIINYLDFDCKTFNDNDLLSRYDHPAEPNKFEYELDGYASEVVYVAQWSKEPVLIEQGSTTSQVVLQTRFTANIQNGNIAHFKSQPNQFFTVLNKTQINNLYTSITFTSILPFVPVVGTEFEIVSNVPIFTKESQINYSTKGCIVDLDKKNFAKVKFLDLSEPNVSQRIIFYYRRLTDLPLTYKNVNSIIEDEIWYKKVSLDDEISLSISEANFLASKILNTKPKVNFSFEIYSNSIIAIGQKITTNLTNFVNENLIVEEINYKDMNTLDQDKNPLILQKIKASNYILNPDKIIERYTTKKKSISTLSETKETLQQDESLIISENVEWSFDSIFLNSPVQLQASQVSNTFFYMNWNFVLGANYYKIQVSTDPLFLNVLNNYNNLNVGNTDQEGISGSEITNNPVFYSRVKAFKNELVFSDWSNVIEIQKLQLKVNINFGNNGSTVDLSGNNNNAVVSPNAVYQNGSLFFPINQIGYIPYNSDLNVNEFSIEIAVKKTVNNSFDVIMSRYDNLQHSFIIQASNIAGIYDFIIYNSPNGYYIASFTLNVLLGVEFILQVSYNQSTKQIVIKKDNVLLSFYSRNDGSNNIVSLNNLVMRLTTARIIVPGFNFQGVNYNNNAQSIRKFKYYSKSLSSNEFQMTYGDMQ